jgi:regulator of replication initiation timing
MKRHLRFLLTGCALLLSGVQGVPAFSQDASDVLKQSSTLLKEQQELDKRLGTNQVQREELDRKRFDVNRQAEQLNNDQQNNQNLCGTTASYYAHKMECDAQTSDLSQRSATVGKQQRELRERYQSTTSEEDLLKAREEQLKERAAIMDEKLKDVELSGSLARECLAQQPMNNPAERAKAYERCSIIGQPKLKSESASIPQVEKPGPIEQMGIEDEKRRKRRARQKENE